MAEQQFPVISTPKKALQGRDVLRIICMTYIGGVVLLLGFQRARNYLVVDPLPEVEFEHEPPVICPEGDGSRYELCSFPVGMYKDLRTEMLLWDVNRGRLIYNEPTDSLTRKKFRDGRTIWAELEIQ